MYVFFMCVCLFVFLFDAFAMKWLGFIFCQNSCQNRCKRRPILIALKNQNTPYHRNRVRCVHPFQGMLNRMLYQKYKFILVSLRSQHKNGKFSICYFRCKKIKHFDECFKEGKSSYGNSTSSSPCSVSREDEKNNK